MNIFEKDRYKAALVSQTGVFEYRQNPFGITNTPTTFQSALDMTLTKFRCKRCLNYLDDVAFFNKMEDHIKHVDGTITAPYADRIKLKKCALFQEYLEYLCHRTKRGEFEIARTDTE